MVSKKIVALITVALLLALPAASVFGQNSGGNGGQPADRIAQLQQKSQGTDEARQEMIGRIRQLAQQIRQKQAEFLILKAESIQLAKQLREYVGELRDEGGVDEATVARLRECLQTMREHRRELGQTLGSLHGLNVQLRACRANRAFGEAPAVLESMLAVQEQRIAQMKTIVNELRAILSQIEN